MDSIQVSDSPWLGAQRRVGQADLARLCGMPAAELDALVKHGGLIPLPGEGATTGNSAAAGSPRCDSRRACAARTAWTW